MDVGRSGENRPLTAMRGIAALAVVIFHLTVNLLGPWPARAALSLWRLRRFLPEAASIRRFPERRAFYRRISLDRQLASGGDRRRLEWYGRKVFSQGDEDGIIAEIFRRIGAPHRSFVEFGAQTGHENNTRHLLSRGWRGLWIEASADHASELRNRFRSEISRGKIAFLEATVTVENIDVLLRCGGLVGEVDFLSIDIDGNDYHVFDAIRAVAPRVVCLEYNQRRPPPDDWVMPYDPAYRWDMSSECGASLVALDRLAQRKGYSLVGTGLYSTNAFFVRSDVVGDHFSPPFTPERFFRQVPYELIATFPRRFFRSTWWWVP